MADPYENYGGYNTEAENYLTTFLKSYYQEITPTTSSSQFSPTTINTDFLDSSRPQWEQFNAAAKGGIIVAVVIGFLIVLFSLWLCCCGRCRARRNQNRNANTNTNTNGESTSATGPQTHPSRRHNRFPSLPLRNLNLPGREHRNDAPPPRYEEVIRGGDLRIAVAPGLNMGNRGEVEEDESAMVVDGKTPLSEIPFEDIELRGNGNGNGSLSAGGSARGSARGGSFSEGEVEGSEARSFGEVHHNGPGDTRGHTNS